MDIVKRVENIEGMLLPNERKFLYKTAGECNGTIVEIGAFKGKSTICIALGKKPTTKFFSIDPHITEETHHGVSGYGDYEKNLKEAGVRDEVNAIVSKSQDVGWKQPIDFLWIDGDHTYQGVKSDFDLYSPYLKEDCVIAFHDSTYDEVKSFVKTVLASGNYDKSGIVGSILYARKHKANFFGRLRNRAVSIFIDAHDWVRALNLPPKIKLVLKAIVK